jgi:hypothetical protein
VPEDTILLTADGIGRGDDNLGRVLMANFLRFQSERSEPVGTVILMNSAVKLACTATADFEAHEYLRQLAGRGARVLSCRTCLEHYGLTESVAIGEIGGMGQFVEIMRAGRVLTI